MAKKEKAQKGKKKGGSFLLKFTVLISALGSIYLFKQGSVLLLVGLLPALVAYMVDETSGKEWFKAVFYFNLTGLMPAISHALTNTGDMPGALQQALGEPMAWLVAYGSAAAGWAVIWLSPKVITWVMHHYNQSAAKHYEVKKEKLETEWGIKTKSVPIDKL